MATTLTFTVEFEVHTCCDCGIHFAVPVRWIEERRADHKSFHCPNGHSLSFKGKSQLERMTEERDQAQAKLNEAAHARAVLDKKLRESEQEIARLKTRVTHGVCTCCNRTFKNLAAHMKTKHPQEIPGGAQKKIAGPVVN